MDVGPSGSDSLHGNQGMQYIQQSSISFCKMLESMLPQAKLLSATEDQHVVEKDSGTAASFPLPGSFPSGRKAFKCVIPPPAALSSAVNLTMSDHIPALICHVCTHQDPRRSERKGWPHFSSLWLQKSGQLSIKSGNSDCWGSHIFCISQRGFQGR